MQNFTVTIPIEDTQMRNRFQLRIVSDDWVVEDTLVPLSMNNYVLPESIRPHTGEPARQRIKKVASRPLCLDLLDLDPLPISALGNSLYQSLYPFEFFNPIQTQVFFALYHTWDNVLIGAPTSSGKTLCAELAAFRLFQHRPGKKVSCSIKVRLLFNVYFFSASTSRRSKRLFASVSKIGRKSLSTSLASSGRTFINKKCC